VHGDIAVVAGKSFGPRDCRSKPSSTTRSFAGERSDFTSTSSVAPGLALKNAAYAFSMAARPTNVLPPASRDSPFSVHIAAMDLASPLLKASAKVRAAFWIASRSATLSPSADDGLTLS
jgi:hypothetical protein